MNRKIRRMTLDDVPEVHRLETTLFPDPWPEQSFMRDVLDRKICHPYIIEEGKEIIGYFVCWYYARELHIGNLAVKKNHHRQGIGKLLMSKIFNIFTGYRFAYLEVRCNNTPAIQLYAKFGFRELYRRRQYYANGDDAVVMIKIRETSQEGNNGLV